MIDTILTYGGGLVAVLALCASGWLLVRMYPSFETFVRGFDDELHLGLTPAEQAWRVRWYRVGWATVILFAVAAVSLAIGYAIPD